MIDRRRQGLTLLEVLAAFLIFSLVFTVLVGSSQSGVQSQGLSSRRLAANEIAESLLTDLEIPLARHELPIIAENEYEQDEFMIRIEEIPLGGEDLAGSRAPDPSELLPLKGSDLIGLIQAQLPDVAQYVMRYEIQVAWQEANDIQKVTRTTFGFDWPTAQADTTGIFGVAAANAAGLDPGEAGSDADGDGDGLEAGDPGSGAGGQGNERGRSKQPSESEIERMKRLIREKEAELGLGRQ